MGWRTLHHLSRSRLFENFGFLSKDDLDVLGPMTICHLQLWCLEEDIPLPEEDIPLPNSSVEIAVSPYQIY